MDMLISILGAHALRILEQLLTNQEPEIVESIERELKEMVSKVNDFLSRPKEDTEDEESQECGVLHYHDHD